MKLIRCERCGKEIGYTDDNIFVMYCDICGEILEEDKLEDK